MSQTYVAQIVIVLALLLPKFGIGFDSEQLTAIVQAIFVLGAAAWTLIRRYQHGDITAAGIRKF